MGAAYAGGHSNAGHAHSDYGGRIGYAGCHGSLCQFSHTRSDCAGWGQHTTTGDLTRSTCNRGANGHPGAARYVDIHAQASRAHGDAYPWPA